VAAALFLVATPAVAGPKEDFARAVSAYKAERYAEALALFESIHSKTADASLLLPIARCHEELGHIAEAATAYEGWLGSGLAKGKSKRDAESRLVTLRERLTRGVLLADGAPAGASVQLDGANHGVVGADGVELPAGPHDLVISAPGHQPKHFGTVEIPPAGSVSVDAALEPLAQEPVVTAEIEPDPVVVVASESDNDGSSMEIAAWATLGAGVAALAGGAVAFGLGEADHEEIRSARGFGGASSGSVSEMSYGEAQDLLDRGDTRKVIGYALWGVGGAAVATSVVLFLLDSDSGGASTVQLSPAAGAGAGGLVLSGQF
jgi:hypothetical protein